MGGWGSEKQLAEYAGVSVKSLQRWRAFGQGPPWKRWIGSIKYKISDFEAWASAQPGGGDAVKNGGSKR